jgi:N-acetylglucosaminyldiphosphoundecaprenol N-acetyl-beta-D-mannosaminyltransferase
MVSDTGLEWMHRLASEPQRMWKRYLVDDLPFGWLLLQQMMNRYQYNLPIGQLLQEAELLSPQQVAEILMMQEQARQRRFGDLVIEQGWLTTQTIDFFADQLPQLSRSRHLPLGEYLKTAALIDEDQIRHILAQQAHGGGRFGDIAVENGLVPQGTVNLVMEQLTKPQSQRSKKAPTPQFKHRFS